MSKLVKPYEIFAQYYDAYMHHVDYERWVEHILSLYKKHTQNPLQRILELACGTANISELLVKKGYIVEACDCSSSMLKYAQAKQFRPFLFQADMTDKLQQEKYDLILCIFDSINYLMDYDKLKLMFNHIAEGLKFEGLFIFDISTYKNSINNFNGYINVEDNPDYCLIHRSNYDEYTHIQTTHFTIFSRKDDHYQRFDENHQQRIYKCTELVHQIAISPLVCEGIYSLAYEKNLYKQNLNKLDHHFSRLFFVLKKLKNEG